jgi:hypothetical protein
MHRMDSKRSTLRDRHALIGSAYDLQRAAGNMLKHARGADDAATLAVALAHVEEALDRLSVSAHQAAHAVTLGYSEGADESTLRPPAQALCFHLRLLAERLREPQLACQSSRSWARRLVDPEADGGDIGSLGGVPDAGHMSADDPPRRIPSIARAS